MTNQKITNMKEKEKENKKTDLSKYDNSWYNTGGSTLKRFIWYYINEWFINCGWVFMSIVKVALLRAFGAKIGKGVCIKPHVNVKYPWNLTIGDYAWIGENVWIDSLVPIHIGNNAVVSQGAMLLTGNHNYKSPSFDLIVKEITIEDGAWVGAQSTVCPGITMKSHSVLTVGSIATKDCEAYCIYQGNPAVKIKDRIIE